MQRYGVIFRLPAYLETLPPSPPPGSVSIIRRPVSLFELLEESVRTASYRSVLDLKIRFQLARQLVQSIYILHAVGWVHKKYIHMAELWYMLPQADCISVSGQSL